MDIWERPSRHPYALMPTYSEQNYSSKPSAKRSAAHRSRRILDNAFSCTEQTQKSTTPIASWHSPRRQWQRWTPSSKVHPGKHGTSPTPFHERGNTHRRRNWDSTSQRSRRTIADLRSDRGHKSSITKGHSGSPLEPPTRRQRKHSYTGPSS